MPSFPLSDIAARTGGRVVGDGSRVVTGALPPDSAGESDLTFAFNEKALRSLSTSRARAVVVAEGMNAGDRDQIVHRNPGAALATILALFHPVRRPEPGVHPTASVHPTAKVGSGVHVGPFAVVERDAVLRDGAVVSAAAFVGAGSVVGEGTVLHPHCVLYPGVVMGRDCIVHSGVVVGADGFGFARAGGKHVKIPQVSGVTLGDDVEIGANSCIDRGTMTPTRVGSNTKLDNLVQIGHNSVIGDRVIICGQCAIAGTTTIEDDCVLAGQVGAAGHLTVGRGSMAAAGTGITSDVEPGSRIAGHPPMKLEDWRRAHASLRHLAEMREELRRLRRQVEDLEARLGEGA